MPSPTPHPDDTITCSLVTVSGAIHGRVGAGRDHLLRFSVKNRSGRFYTQCPQERLQHPERLLPGARVLITGKLLSVFNTRIRRHQTVIRALSLSVIDRGRILSLLPDDTGARH
ncbi:MAG: hypothetical protein D6722_23930 [Bacteroidetes bacterium]|nr:MAG: hypothetical protein D6722_23930 [Bacteroidota bacterium]